MAYEVRPYTVEEAAAIVRKLSYSFQFRISLLPEDQQFVVATRVYLNDLTIPEAVLSGAVEFASHKLFEDFEGTIGVCSVANTIGQDGPGSILVDPREIVVDALLPENLRVIRKYYAYSDPHKQLTDWPDVLEVTDPLAPDNLEVAKKMLLSQMFMAWLVGRRGRYLYGYLWGGGGFVIDHETHRLVRVVWTETIPENIELLETPPNWINLA